MAREEEDWPEEKVQEGNGDEHEPTTMRYINENANGLGEYS